MSVPDTEEFLITPDSCSALSALPAALAETWHSRELLVFLAWRDIKVRYKQTVLGAAWAILQPVLLMVIFTLFLGRVAQLPSGNLPYALFVYVGLLPWFLFATGVTNAGNSLLESERLITKVYFPRLVVPFGSASAALVDFIIACGFLVVLMIAYGQPIVWQMLLAPLFVIPIFLTALGVGTFLSALNVQYRDFRYVLPFLIQAWMFGTPSIYFDVTAAGPDLPAIVRLAMEANPMTGLIAGFRAALLDTPIPWAEVGRATAVGLAAFVVGCTYFRRVEDRFADWI